MIFFAVTVLAFIVLTGIRFLAWAIHRVFTSEPVTIQLGFSEPKPQANCELYEKTVQVKRGYRRSTASLRVVK